MHKSHLIFPLLSLLVVTYAAPDERKKFVRVITEPKPGDEYVSIQTGKPSSSVHAKSSESDIHVNIQDEGQTGIKEVTGSIPAEEKIYVHKKLYPSNEEGPRRLKPEKKYTQVNSDDIIVPDSSVIKPINKQKIKRDGQITTHKPLKDQDKSSNNKDDEGLYDFVDSPFGGQIVGSASSQASRVNIKKAPNGQEYEYEYVYYYYDEDEEHNGKPGSKTSQSTSNTPPASQQTNSRSKENNKSKKPTAVPEENKFVQSTNKGRFTPVEHTTTDESEGHTNFAVNDITEHNNKIKESARNLEEALSVPSSSQAVSEERLPPNPRFPTRSRGNTKPVQEFATTILPATDTPITRIRSNNGATHQPGLDLVDSSAFRTHSSNAQHTATSPRHESNRDAVVQTTPADQVATINNAYNTQLTETVVSVTETVNLDRDQDNTDVDTKVLSLTTTLTPDEVVTVTNRYSPGSTDKGAVDLYAILQQTRSEETGNTISSSSEHSTRFEDNETQFPTTLRLAPTTTTTTTTTPAPTTTTTTTTTAAPTRQSSGSGPVRSRYRGNAGTRNGLTPSTTTTTTTETPAVSEEVTEKRKFKPTRERNTQGSVYSKRYQSSTAALEKESSTTESEVSTRAQKPSFGGRQRTRASKPVSSTVPIDENVEVTSAAPKPNFAERSNLRRQNSRNKFTTTGSTTSTTTSTTAPHVTEEEESNVAEHEVSEPTTTTAKAVGGRLRPNIRPLRPGLRLNFGGKGSSTTAIPVPPPTTQAPVAESSPDEIEEKEVVQETSPTPAPDSLSRLKNKSRFRIPEKQASIAPKQQTLAPPATGQNRKHLLSNLLPKKKSIQTEEPPVVEEVKPVLENEQENDQSQELQNEEDLDRQQPSSTTTSTTEAPTSSTNRLSSLLAKRRPLQRRPADLSSKQSNQEE